MGLDFAIDELYASGWLTLESTGCESAVDGRLFPGIERIEREFRDAGFQLSIRKIDVFDCFRAEWRAAGGDAAGAVVGQSQSEAAVYALAQFRRSAAHASA